MKIRNDGIEKFIGEFKGITYSAEPNEVIEIPNEAWELWVGSTKELKSWTKKYWGGKLPHLCPVDSRRKKK